MAKVKKTLEGNWEIMGGGIMHRNWAGTTFRTRGSKTAYVPGCRFEKKPPIPTIWTVHVDGYEPQPFTVVLLFGVQAFNEDIGIIGTRVDAYQFDGVEIPMLTLFTLSVDARRDFFAKVYRVVFGPLPDPIIDTTITLQAPPFNNQPLPAPNLDSQQHVA